MSAPPDFREPSGWHEPTEAELDAYVAEEEAEAAASRECDARARDRGEPSEAELEALGAEDEPEDFAPFVERELGDTPRAWLEESVVREFVGRPTIAPAAIIAAGVRAECFADQACRAIFEAAVAVHEQGGAPDEPAVRRELARRRIDLGGSATNLLYGARNTAAPIEEAEGIARGRAHELLAAHRAAEAEETLRKLGGAIGRPTQALALTETLRGLLEAASPNGLVGAAAARIESQPWRDFARETPAAIEWLVRGLIALGAFVFIASAPKKGKTWVVLDLGLAVVLGRRFLARFAVDTARPVLLVMLEGHRAAIRDRIGAMARGAGVDPDGPELDALHVAYKPRGINLADPGWAAELCALAADLDAALVGVDVLRAAARLPNENAVADFTGLAANLRPLADEGRTVAFAHHFAKLTELAKERTPGERMSGTGAMHGALDAGIFITGSQQGARVLRVEFAARDTAEPDPLGVRLVGTGTGENGSFTYADSCSFVADDAPAAAELKAPPAAIAAWVREQGGEATPAAIRQHFDIADSTLRERRADLAKLGIRYLAAGRESLYVDDGDPLQPRDDPAPATPRPSRGNASRGQLALEQAESTPHPAHPATKPTREAESADLQGNLLPRDPALPTGASPAPRGAPRSGNEPRGVDPPEGYSSEDAARGSA